MKKGNVLAVLLATVGIMLFGTLAVSADAHAGIQSASGKSGVPTAIAENESGAVTSAKASVGKSRKAKASANTVADSGLYQVKIAGDICPSAGSRAMDLINQYRKANGKAASNGTILVSLWQLPVRERFRYTTMPCVLPERQDRILSLDSMMKIRMRPSTPGSTN